MKIKSFTIFTIMFVSNFALCMAGGGEEELPSHKVVVSGNEILVYAEDNERVDAARANNPEGLSLNSDDDFDINAECHNGNAPLIFALTHGGSNHRTALIRLLLEYNADINQREMHSKRMPLHIACGNVDDTAILEELILLGAYVNAKDRNLRTPISYCISPNASTINPVRQTRAFLEAVRKRNAAKKSNALEQNNDSNNPTPAAAAESAPVNPASQSKSGADYWMREHGL